MKVFFDTSVINLVCKSRYEGYEVQLKDREEELRYIEQLLKFANSGRVKIYSHISVENELQCTKNEVLKQRHRIRDDADVDFTIRNTADAISILTTITDALRIFLTAMAGIALLVGGIGILNIMLVTVAERTREIGLRKAVGANNRAIRNQFLFEAGTLTLLGGLVGIVMGIIAAYLISLLMNKLGYDWAFVISITSVVLAIGVSIITGVAFGLYPALKASKLNPIDALRYE
jgi:putative ABC transport system permease protein